MFIIFYSEGLFTQIVKYTESDIIRSVLTIYSERLASKHTENN